jgi:chromosome segregation and condensation protein ScpB
MLSERQVEFFSKRRAMKLAKMELRRQIRVVLLAAGKPLSVEELSQALWETDQVSLQRELWALSRVGGSDIWHNGSRGRGSRYGVGIKLVTE